MKRVKKEVEGEGEEGEERKEEDERRLMVTKGVEGRVRGTGKRGEGQGRSDP